MCKNLDVKDHLFIIKGLFEFEADQRSKIIEFEIIDYLCFSR